MSDVFLEQLFWFLDIIFIACFYNPILKLGYVLCFHRVASRFFGKMYFKVLFPKQCWALIWIPSALFSWPEATLEEYCLSSGGLHMYQRNIHCISTTVYPLPPEPFQVSKMVQDEDLNLLSQCAVVHALLGSCTCEKCRTYISIKTWNIYGGNIYSKVRHWVSLLVPPTLLLHCYLLQVALSKISTTGNSPPPPQSCCLRSF